MIGDKANPFTHAPADWDENGVPYGAFCKCSNCGLLHRSTVAFDCYADNPGDPLTCESCKVGGWGIGGREAFENEIFKGQSNNKQS